MDEQGGDQAAHSWAGMMREAIGSLDARAKRTGSLRHLATALSDDEIVAVAGVERDVQIWSVERASLLSEFETILDFGGHRLALCTPSDRIVVVAGAWERLGVAGYDGSNGDRLGSART